MSIATATAPAAAPARTPTTPVADLILLVRRALRRETRQLDALFVSVLLPVLIMVMFVTVFGGAIDTGDSGVSYINYVVPGVIVMCAGYGAAMTAGAITGDLTGGMLDRFRTLPIRGWAVPGSHVVASVIRNLGTTAIALAAAFAVGFRAAASLTDWLLVVAVVGGYILAVAWLAVVWGLLVRSMQAAEAFSFLVLFVPYVSSAFVPVETMSPLLRTIAEHQPTTPIVDTLRGLLLGRPTDDSIGLATAWLVAAIVISAPVAAVLFRRRTAR